MKSAADDLKALLLLWADVVAQIRGTTATIKPSCKVKELHDKLESFSDHERTVSRIGPANSMREPFTG